MVLNIDSQVQVVLTIMTVLLFPNMDLLPCHAGVASRQEGSLDMTSNTACNTWKEILGKATQD